MEWDTTLDHPQQHPLRFNSVDAFDMWERTQPGTWELHGGEAVALVPEGTDYATINDLLLSEMRRWDTEHLRLRIEQAKLDAQAAEFSVDRLLVPLAVFGVMAGATGGLVVLLFCGIGH